MNPTSQDSQSPFSKGVQHRAKRDAILSRAAKLFNTRGARATTLSDVADRLGLTKTSLYYYVRTKEDLIFQCYLATMRQSHDRLDRIEKGHPDPLDRVLEFLSQHFDTTLDALEGRDSYYAAPLEIASLSEEHRTVIEDLYLSMFKRIRGYIREGVASGSIKSCHETTTTRALLGALDWSFYWLYEMPREEAHHAAAAMRDLVSNGLVARQDLDLHNLSPTSLTGVAPEQGFDREVQNRLKQEAFYKAAARFFNIKGFNGTSLDEIADYLQVSKGAFYYHFANKEELLTQCYNYSLGMLDDILSEAEHREGPAILQLDLAFRKIFTLQNSDQGPLIRYKSITALPPDPRRQILARTERTNSRIGKMIEAGMKDGSVRPVNSVIAQHLITGALNASIEINRWRRVENMDLVSSDYFNVFYFGLANH